MSNRICREISLTDTISLNNSTSTSGAFVMGQDAGGLIYCVTAGGGTEASPVTNTPVVLNFYIDPRDSGARVLLCDSSNAAISLTIQGNRCYALPDALFGAGKVVPVITTNTTAIIRVGLKT